MWDRVQTVVSVTAGGGDGTAVRLADVFLMKTAVILWRSGSLLRVTECSYVVISPLLLK